jgi:hypothetical protein
VGGGEVGIGGGSGIHGRRRPLRRRQMGPFLCNSAL